MWQIAGFVLAVLANGTLMTRPSPLPAANARPSVALVLSAVKSVARVGEAPPRVRVEMRNNGQEDFILSEDLLPILNAATYVVFELEDSTGHQTPATGMYIERSFSARNSSWTKIALGHYYGVEFDLDLETYPALKKPGLYKLKAKYVSRGGNTPASPEWDVPTYRVWEGEITSNTISVEILPGKGIPEPQK